MEQSQDPCLLARQLWIPPKLPLNAVTKDVYEFTAAAAADDHAIWGNNVFSFEKLHTFTIFTRYGPCTFELRLTHR